MNRFDGYGTEKTCDRGAAFLYKMGVPAAAGDAELAGDLNSMVLRNRRRARAGLAALSLALAAAEPGLGDDAWWSLRPLQRPALPSLSPEEIAPARAPVDAFVIAKLREHGLSLSPEADRRTLIRRLSFDLLGLPPDPGDVESFVADPDPLAYERLVDRYLASPRLGERWARHWLDVVHYADTHGYDKDKLRPNAWPYRDYVIRAFNEDKPYARFVREQIAGDVLYPDTVDGIVATGLIAAGPWDFIGHAEVPETKIDGRIARHLDRDDMVRTAISAFTSTTVGCARCHDHKFDPISMADYYNLQSVFAALDRADRPYEPDAGVAGERRSLTDRRQRLEARQHELDSTIRRRGGEALAAIERRIDEVRESEGRDRKAAFGYHSRIETDPDLVKWVQVDLGRSVPIARIIHVGCHDDFNGIGAGFGFPRRYKIEIGDDADFASGAVAVLDRTQDDVPNPGVTPIAADAGGRSARYVRVTATRLAPRQNDFIFALAELIVIDAVGANAARGAAVTALDSIEAPPRWQRANLVDGYYYGAEAPPAGGTLLAALEAERLQALSALSSEAERRELEGLRAEIQDIRGRLASLPAPGMVYAGVVYSGSGAFRGTGSDGGKPREIRILKRGDILTPGDAAQPAALPMVTGLPAGFDLPEGHAEGERRRALAEWLVDSRQPLTWRSIVNRLWQHHFGRALVDTPNDFGRMGQPPTHPELLDWLAASFRDRGGSLKEIHRLLVTSAVYRQSSAENEAAAGVDAENRWLWRMNRRRLEAEALRDGALAVSGRLNDSMYGPAFWCFVLEKPEHSPHYQYHKHDPDDPATHRRSIYRFIVRSQPDPFMDTLDCADSSQLVDKRNETLTALQALALLNNPFMILMAEHFAARLERETEGLDLDARIDRAFRVALGRGAEADERQALAAHARRHGLASACRAILNLNEFVFVD
jgi:hypothetical protein